MYLVDLGATNLSIAFRTFIPPQPSSPQQLYLSSDRIPALVVSRDGKVDDVLVEVGGGQVGGAVDVLVVEFGLEELEQRLLDAELEGVPVVGAFFADAGGDFFVVLEKILVAQNHPRVPIRSRYRRLHAGGDEVTEKAKLPARGDFVLEGVAGVHEAFTAHEEQVIVDADAVVLAVAVVVVEEIDRPVGVVYGRVHRRQREKPDAGRSGIDFQQFVVIQDGAVVDGVEPKVHPFDLARAGQGKQVRLQVERRQIVVEALEKIIARLHFVFFSGQQFVGAGKLEDGGEIVEVGGLVELVHGDVVVVLDADGSGNGKAFLLLLRLDGLQHLFRFSGDVGLGVVLNGLVQRLGGEFPLAGMKMRQSDVVGGKLVVLAVQPRRLFKVVDGLFVIFPALVGERREKMQRAAVGVFPQRIVQGLQGFLVFAQLKIGDAEVEARPFQVRLQRQRVVDGLGGFFEVLRLQVAEPPCIQLFGGFLRRDGNEARCEEQRYQNANECSTGEANRRHRVRP